MTNMTQPETTPNLVKADQPAKRKQSYLGFIVVLLLIAGGIAFGIHAVTGGGQQSPASGGCVSAVGVTSAITDGLNPGVTLTGPIMAVKSKDFQQVYMVASHVSGDSQNVPVWAVSSLDAPGVIMSAEAFAKLYSAYPRHDGMDAGSDGVAEAQSCVS